MVNFKTPLLVKILDVLYILVALTAVVSLITEYGFYLSESMMTMLHRLDVIIVWYFVVYGLMKLYLSKNRLTYIKLHWFNYCIILIILLETILFIRVLGFRLFTGFFNGRELIQLTKLYIIGFQVSIILSIITHATKLNQKIATYRFHPAQILMGSFLTIIIIGTALLMLPKSVAPGNSLSFVDALFTSTSATCVTGLIVVDTGTHFSLLGQLIILLLIQVGGLGIMTYASFFALILRRTISLREKSMIGEMLNYENIGLISRLLISTIIFTLTTEAIGSIFLFIGFGNTVSGFWERVYTSVFHAVSAFCNAGFSLYSLSFMGYSGNYLLVITLSILIIIGGLGFPVLVNLFGLKLSSKMSKGKWLSVQSRLVFGISTLLILVGSVCFILLEKDATLGEFNWPDKILNGFFQSVTARTAGFNTVDIGLISTPSVLLLVLLMFIGASPGSTGGGIKTTTFGIIFAGVWSVIKGRNRIELFKKNIPFTVLNRALVIFMFSLAFIVLITFILSITEDLPFLDIFFESFSAFGTVGLSRGITPYFSNFGKALITIAMFFGRLGALTISLAITTPREVYHYNYPTENVMVG